MATLERFQKTHLTQEQLREAAEKVERVQRLAGFNEQFRQANENLERFHRALDSQEQLKQATERFERWRRVLASNATLTRNISPVTAALAQQTVATHGRRAAAQRLLPPATRPASPVATPTPAPRPEAVVWREAGVHFKRQVFAHLIQIDATLIVRLDGAWERVARGGPHAGSQAAHSAAEFFDWCLRTLAMDDEVIAWHGKHGRSQSELHDNRPTRGLRMRYILRNRDPDGPLSSEYIRHGLEVVKLLQGARHGDGSNRDEIAALILSAETVLAFLLLQST